MSAPGAVLFDMDGVIFDSERALMACWQVIGDRMGLGDMTAAYHDCTGVTFEATEKILKTAYGEDFPWLAFRAESTALYLKRWGETAPPLKPGVRELLAFLHERGAPVALASSTKGALVRRFLSAAGLLEQFDLLFTGDQVSRSKPDPEIFLKACAGLGAAPGESFVIEDSYNGVRAAHAGGFHTLMVPDLLAPDREMETLCQAILPSLVEVKAYLERVLA